MGSHNLAKRLQRVEHFNNISLEEVERIILAGTIKSFAKNQVIFSEEEPSSGMYVLLNGQVQLCKISLQGQISILSVINPVIMFNEVFALDNGPNPITAVADQDSLIWHPGNRLFRKLLAIV